MTENKSKTRNGPTDAFRILVTITVGVFALAIALGVLVALNHLLTEFYGTVTRTEPFGIVLGVFGVTIAVWILMYGIRTLRHTGSPIHALTHLGAFDFNPVAARYREIYTAIERTNLWRGMMGPTSLIDEYVIDVDTESISIFEPVLTLNDTVVCGLPINVAVHDVAVGAHDWAQRAIPHARTNRALRHSAEKYPENRGIEITKSPTRYYEIALKEAQTTAPVGCHGEYVKVQWDNEYWRVMATAVISEYRSHPCAIFNEHMVESFTHKQTSETTSGPDETDRHHFPVEDIMLQWPESTSRDYRTNFATSSTESKEYEGEYV